MRSRLRLWLAASVAVAGVAACGTTSDDNPMSFFVTSHGVGNGADLGGLAGADRHCQSLAAKAGAGHRSWRAYLSTQAQGDAPAVHARDRIGPGPWRNAKGVVVASSVDALHGSNTITKETALTQDGLMVLGRGDTPNQHDILTGSTAEGRASDATCGNWTQSGEGAAMVGHHDRRGLDESDAAKSWNASHRSRGCSQQALQSSGGAGLMYCFAVR